MKTGVKILLVVLALLVAAALFLALTPPGRQALGWVQRQFAPAEGTGGGAPAATSAPPAPAPAEPQPAHQLPADPFLRDGYFLEIAPLTQHPELRNGCEATALAMVLGYLGFNADKTDLADNYIPRQEFTYNRGVAVCGHPEEVYPGDAATPMGFYCFPPVVCEGANLYLAAQPNAPYEALDISGADEATLMEYVSGGLPVVLWKTTNHLPPETREDLAWQLSGSREMYAPYGNLHVVVLCGFDVEFFYMLDPYGMMIRMERELLMADYEAMGSRAMVVAGR